MGFSSSDTEKPHTAPRKHNRSSSSDQPSKSQIYIISNHTNNTSTKPMEEPPTPTSPRSPSKQSSRSHRPDSKRRKSSVSSTTKHKTSRPSYSRKYSTPPSRPLSPSGFPQLLENDMCIPEIDLNHVGASLRQQTQTAPPTTYRVEPRPLNVIHYAPAPTPTPSMHYISQSHSQSHSYPQSMGVEVDTAPQEPDIWSDPETDYFSSIEGPAGRKAYHARGHSRRQLSQNLSGLGSLNAVMAGGAGAKALHQIHEDSEAEFLDLQIPGGFA